MLHPEQAQEDNRTEYPPDDILFNLGLTLENLRGLRILDLGCGPTGGFVQFLRKHGIEAFGLDSRPVANSPFLMMAEADAIPKPEVPYDLIIAHLSVFRLGNSTFYNFLTNNGRLDEETHTMNLFAMGCILQEMKRVIRIGGKAVIFPHPDELNIYFKNGRCQVENIFDLDGAEHLMATFMNLPPQNPAIAQRLIISY